MKTSKGLIIGVTMGCMALSSGALADPETDYRSLVMQISKSHFKAIEGILSGVVAHPETLHRHAKGLQVNTEILPHLYDPYMKNRQKSGQPTMDNITFFKAVEESQDAMAKLTATATKFVEARSHVKKGASDTTEVKQAFDKVKSKCMACHTDLAD
ncbi:MAG: cytochrome c [Magnetococcales bacterium]|nr:cytochrome c [Magnetococcales bacterium]